MYAAPRRLAVLIEQLEEQQADRSMNLDGPPIQAAFDADGNPTQAALGFARKCGVDIAEIDRSGAKLRFAQHIPGQPAVNLLPTIVAGLAERPADSQAYALGRPSRRVRAPDPVAGDAVR